MIVLQILHNLSVVLLSVVGFNALVLSLIFLMVYRKQPINQPEPVAEWPSVLVQLPIYNERHVAERLIGAISKLDYPRDRLSVQVLDDSNDDTVALAKSAVDRAREGGLRIDHIRREKREGFKAGALGYGLTLSDEEFVAVFDADFVPEPAFLKMVLPYMIHDPVLGVAQTRWAHLNAEFSLLTRAQALALDGHFVVEQTSRDRGGLLMNFAGTAGIWRRKAIDDAGGWQSDTLSEDIDLSYRAQLRGWNTIYLPDIGTPSEITPLMMGFKQQQARWATGTIQCLRKLGRTLITTPHLDVWQKLQAFLQLGAYFVHPLMIVLVITTLPLLLSQGAIREVGLAGLGLAMFGPPLEMVLAQRYLYRDWRRRLMFYPVAMLIGIGIAVKDTEAVLKGLFTWHTAFHRTPKFHIQGKKLKWSPTMYTVPVDYSVWIETLLALYAGLTAVVSLQYEPALFPFMTLCSLGFAYTAGVSLWQAGLGRRVHVRQQELELSSNT